LDKIAHKNISGNYQGLKNVKKKQSTILGKEIDFHNKGIETDAE